MTITFQKHLGQQVFKKHSCSPFQSSSGLFIRLPSICVCYVIVPCFQCLSTWVIFTDVTIRLATVAGSHGLNFNKFRDTSHLR